MHQTTTMGDEIDPMVFLEEGGYVLETVTEDSREFHTESLSTPMQQMSALSSDTIEEEEDDDAEEGQQNQPVRRRDELPEHRGPSGQHLVSTADDDDDDDDDDENDKHSVSTVSAGSDSSIGIDTDLESMDVTADGDGNNQKRNSTKRKSVKFTGTLPGRGRKTRPPPPPSSKHVRIRKAEMRGAMDENIRYRHQIRRRLSSKVKHFFGNFEGDDDIGSAGDDESMEMAMHGRLMVKPSQRNLNVEKSDSSLVDEEEKRREETQYRLTTMRRVRFHYQFFFQV